MADDMKIEDATQDTQIGGGEFLPISDNGSPKKIQLSQIKDYVYAYIASLEQIYDVEDIVFGANDGIYIRSNGMIYVARMNEFTQKILSFLDSSQAESVNTNDQVIFRRNGVCKKTTFTDIATFIKNTIQLDAFNLAELTPKMGSLDAADALLFGKHSSTTEGGITTDQYTNKRMTISDLFGEIVSALCGYIQPKASYAEGYDDVLLLDTDGAIRSISPEAFGFGKGDVKGPATNTNDYIPQWNGSNSKTLKDGLSVVTSVSSTSSATEVPTASAVYNAVNGILKTASGVVRTQGKILRFASNGEVTTGPVVSTEEVSPHSDNAVLTEKATISSIENAITAALATGASPGAITTAIATAITNALASGGAIRTELDGCAKINTTTTSGNIATWSSTNKQLASGYGVSTSIGSSATDQKIPTELAVKNAIENSDLSNVAKIETTTTQYQIPRWGSTQKTFDFYGYSVSTIVPNYGSENELMTSGAILKAVKRSAKVQSYAPTTSSGSETGEMVYSTDESTKGLYINTGDTSASVWVKIAVPIV